MLSKSRALFSEAKQYLPGGVNSPVRAFKAVGGEPFFLQKGEGCRIVDVDGNEYIDYVCSWGPLILGHAYPPVVEVISRTAARGTSFGAPTSLETEMARLVVEAVPSVEMVRMVNSGTEAVMSAIRLARGYTGREKIVKFAGCYHGHGDSLLIKAGSGVSTLGLPDSPGVTSGTAGDIIVVSYNDLPAVKEVFELAGEEIAGIIVEPVAGNMGLVLPEKGFLEGLREITRRYGALLIFDEVMTGFRLSYGGAQERFQVFPDLTTLGKIIGGGLPVGAYGGKKEIMEQVAPSGAVYQAGTLSGNPLAMAAGIETLTILKEPGTYEKLEKKSAQLARGLENAAEIHHVDICFKRAGSMFCTYFSREEVTDFRSAAASDVMSFNVFFHTLLENGVYIAPSQFEAGFVSLVHGDEDIKKTITAAEKAFAAVKKRLG
ncbi:MAG: glutamate-1-semialdehyde-2,1-aminomutase [Dethiobacter sp.]|jgi:glutamate-1-semialdehyde 2,1-aminomutase|nr:MAG: glutamate-1-semialdehyde-2,1-aminomutase [Dethiobacter sp.]